MSETASDHTDDASAPTFADKLLNAHVTEARARLDAASLIAHPGERGSAREHALMRFFREVAPRGFDVDTGFVIDSHGHQSRQQDLVIVRRDYHPVFRTGSAKFFPVEAVAAVIEVKSELSSSNLQDALNNGASVKGLDRSAGGLNYLVLGGAGGIPCGPVQQDLHAHQVFSMVIAAHGVRPETALGAMESFLSHNPRRLWPNVVAIAGEWSMAYTPPDLSTGVRSNQMEGVALRFARPGHRGNPDPLADAAEQLWSFLRITPLIDVSPARYLKGGVWSYEQAVLNLPNA